MGRPIAPGEGSHRLSLAFGQGCEHALLRWVGDSESMGGRVIGAGGGGPHITATDRGR
jgi:hypothetical protein